MSYKARHAEPSALVKAAARGGVIASAAAIVAAGAGALGAGTASAAATPLSVALSSCGSGSSAVWNASAQPVLTVGTAGAGQCGAPANATYNPAYAQVTFTAVKGDAVPQSEPTFDTNNYASGSPRIEIDLNNGHQLTGFPSESGLNGTDMAWSDDQHPNTYTDYSKVYSESLAYETTVKDAYIVEDADQVPGTPDTLTNIQFGGQNLAAPTKLTGYIKNVNSGKCLDIGPVFGTPTPGDGLTQWTCGSSGGVNQNSFTLTTEPDGKTQYLTFDGLYVTGSTQGAQLTLESTPATVTRSGSFYKLGSTGLVMDVTDWSKTNGATVHGWPQEPSNNLNQQWSLP